MLVVMTLRSVAACSGGLFYFILGKLASTPSGEYPVAIVRHVVSLQPFSKPEASTGRSERQKLCVKALVGIAGRAGYQRAQTSWNQAA